MICCKCGKKLTQRQTYYIDQIIEGNNIWDIKIQRRPVCKLHYDEVKNNGR